VHPSWVRDAGGRVFPTAPPVGLSLWWVGERWGRAASAARPPRTLEGALGGYADLVSQKIFDSSSMASRSFCPWAGSSDDFALPASFVALQNSSWSCG